jgi:transcription elongation factor Elf1
MELINKKDAIHAVLHNQGDAAVAAVQEIKAVDAESLVMCGDCDLYNDLKEEHLELIRRLPKAFTEPQQYRFCPYCGEHGIHLRCTVSEFDVRGIHVKCDELIAECSSCGQEIYVPSVNDWNCENREYAYQVAKAKRGERDGRTD